MIQSRCRPRTEARQVERWAAVVVVAVLSLASCKKNAERADPADVSAEEKAAAESHEDRAAGAERVGEEPHLRGIVQIDSATWSTCALDEAGAVYCWGTIETSGFEGGHPRPVRINGLPRVRQIRVRDSVFEALGQDDKLYWWGFRVGPFYEPLPPRPECLRNRTPACEEPPRYDVDPSLDPELARKRFPQEVSAVDIPDWWVGKTPQLRNTRRAFFSRVTSDGSFLTGIGIHERSKREIVVLGFEKTIMRADDDVLALVLATKGDDELFACTVERTGKIRCGHRMEAGLLTETAGFEVTLPTSLRSVGVGDDPGMVAALADGRVAHWDGSDVHIHPAVADIVKVDANGIQACGIDSKGRVACWLHPKRHERPGATSPGVRERIEPKIIDGVEGAVEVTTSGIRTCVLKEDGRVQCWGSNRAGACGVGATTDWVKEPAYVLAAKKQ